MQVEHQWLRYLWVEWRGTARLQGRWLGIITPLAHARVISTAGAFIRCKMSKSTTFSAHMMDSQLTLLNPSPPPSLVFSNSSVKNTSIYLSTEPKTPLYHITSDNHDYDLHIQDARTQCIIATVQRKDILPDLIIFPGLREGKSSMKVRVSKWMRKGKLAGDG